MIETPIPEIVTITVACITEECAEYGTPIEVETLIGARVICGTCGRLITTGEGT